MIYIGYQGIGKSSISGKNNCIDLESSNFFVGQYRVDDWYIIYCNIAEHLSKQGFNVFMSSHQVIRDEFRYRGTKFTVICPSPDLKDQWIERLQTRYNNSNLEKDYKALMNAKDRYSENIKELMSEENVIIIDQIDYNLLDYIK